MLKKNKKLERNKKNLRKLTCRIVDTNLPTRNQIELKESYGNPINNRLE